MFLSKSHFPITVLILLYIVSIGSYVNFATYRPKALSQLPEVKSYRTKSTDSADLLPTPANAHSLIHNKTSMGISMTFISTQSPKELSNFYKNILRESAWSVESDLTGFGQVRTKYKQDKKRLTVVATETVEGTFVTIEMVVNQ